MPDLEKWIQEQFDAGYSQQQILQSLLDSGYTEKQARSTLQKVLNQRKSQTKPMLSQHKGLISFLIILLIISLVSSYYFSSFPSFPSLSPQKPSINVTRELHEEVSPGSRLGVLLKASSEEPIEVELYEKLPTGFEMIESISSHPSKKLQDNVYFFNITKKPDTYGVGITYFVRVPKNASGSYQIQGWYKAENQKININPSNFIVKR